MSHETNNQINEYMKVNCEILDTIKAKYIPMMNEKGGISYGDCKNYDIQLTYFIDYKADKKFMKESELISHVKYQLKDGNKNTDDISDGRELYMTEEGN